MPRTKQTTAATTENTDGGNGNGEKKSKGPRKSPRVRFEQYMDKLNTMVETLTTAKYASAGEDFGKCVGDAKVSVTAALALVRGLPDDWTFSKAKGSRKRKGFQVGEWVKAKEKFLDTFREKGLGAGPFKVLGAFATDKSIKLATPEGSVYLPQREVEKVTVPANE